jgi:hypothetical protein
MKAIASESDAQPRYCGWSQDLYATTSSEIVEALFGILRVSTCSSPSVCVFFFGRGHIVFHNRWRRTVAPG